MAFLPHLRLFELAEAIPTTSSQTFHYFPKLPTELRLKIWRHALHRQRILKVRLRSRWVVDEMLVEARREARPEACESERKWDIVVDGYQTLSKLFHINREARDVALAFHRVHLSCWLIKGRTRDEDAIQPGMLFFNPEHDFLHIRGEKAYVAEFLHDLRSVHDPRHIGVRNLAVGRKDMLAGESICSVDPSDLSPALKSSFTEIIRQLDEVFFVVVQRVGGRVRGHWRILPPAKGDVYPSFPMTAQALNFDRLKRDPRPIDQGLTMIYMHSEPRDMLDEWRQLLEHSFGEGVVPSAKLRILWTYALDQEIYNYQDAKDWVKLEEDIWMMQNVVFSHPGIYMAGESDETIEAVFGFWLFPVEAFGGLSQNADESFSDRRQRMKGMTQYWPELGMLNLP